MKVSSKAARHAGREGTPVLTVVKSKDPTPAAAPAASPVGESLIDEIVRDGARQMLAAALEAEVAAYLVALVRARARFERGKLVERPAKKVAA